jgi:ABC-type lipoprotein release transport system permease subunit
MPVAGRFMYSFGEDELPFISVGSATAAAVALGGGIVLLIALCACTVPTIRALRVEPTEALRGEG